MLILPSLPSSFHSYSYRSFLTYCWNCSHAPQNCSCQPNLDKKETGLNHNNFITFAPSLLSLLFPRPPSHLTHNGFYKHFNFGHCTETALLKITNDLFMAADWFIHHLTQHPCSTDPLTSSFRISNPTLHCIDLYLLGCTQLSSTLPCWCASGLCSRAFTLHYLTSHLYNICITLVFFTCPFLLIP